MPVEFLPPGAILLGLLRHLLPVLVPLVAILGASFALRRRLGLYGRLFASAAGTIGLGLVLFWLLTALMADAVAPFDPYAQIRSLQNALPGALDPEAGAPYLLGGDALGRDVFSRLVHGARVVATIAPLATLLAYAAGIGLGLPAGYLGGAPDAVLSFLANLVLSFPVILLFYLLVSPEIRQTALPTTMAAVLFLFPLLVLALIVGSRLRTRPRALALGLAAVLLPGGAAYLGLLGLWDPTGRFRLDPGTLTVFLAVAFVTTPTVFRIVRGLALELRSRGYVAAARTRGERPSYIMLWEILPNARGPLIVDACLRIGYSTILLGTLGFFGLGVGPESPDWGSTINGGRRLLRLYIHPALPPALALMSLVLGLNLLADVLREEAAQR